jgi:hypothetical protein
MAMKRLDTGEGEKVNLNTGRLKAVEKKAQEKPEPAHLKKPAPAPKKKGT